MDSFLSILSFFRNTSQILYFQSQKRKDLEQWKQIHFKDFIASLQSWCLLPEEMDLIFLSHPIIMPYFHAFLF